MFFGVLRAVVFAAAVSVDQREDAVPGLDQGRGYSMHAKLQQAMAGATGALWKCSPATYDDCLIGSLGAEPLAEAANLSEPAGRQCSDADQSGRLVLDPGDYLGDEGSRREYLGLHAALRRLKQLAEHVQDEFIRAVARRAAEEQRLRAICIRQLRRRRFLCGRLRLLGRKAIVQDLSCNAKIELLVLWGQPARCPVTLGPSQCRHQHLVVDRFGGVVTKVVFNHINRLILIAGKEPLVVACLWVQNAAVSEEDIEEFQLKEQQDPVKHGNTP